MINKLIANGEYPQGVVLVDPVTGLAYAAGGGSGGGDATSAKQDTQITAEQAIRDRLPEALTALGNLKIALQENITIYPYTLQAEETSHTFSTVTEGMAIPLTISWASSDVARKIEISLNNGVSYHEMDYDISTTASEQVLTVNSKFTHGKVTGVAGDILTVSY